MDRVRVGVIGLGVVGQVMHLPYLRELSDRFEIAALCDLSAGTMAAIAQQYGVRACFTDYRELCASPDVDAVMVLTNDSHAPQAIAAASSGKHVFVEKPLCYTERQADEILAATQAAGVRLMVGYMKRYDPGYLRAQERIARLRDDLVYVQINTLHPPIQMHLGHHPIVRVDDVPAERLAQLRAETDRLTAEALGRHRPWLDHAWPNFILGSMCHDVNALRGLIGQPAEVLYADLWDGGWSIATLLRYEPDVRCYYSWTYLRDLRHYRETLSFYGNRHRLHLEFPSPFLKSTPTLVVSEGMDGDVAWEKTELASYEEAFKQELIHFHECVTRGLSPRTDGEDGKRDVKLLRQIALAWPGAAEAP
ncbi:MAG TPA: Gfo/Idh/MocA family oxidoreductase [Chloroflexota bacterium]|nr:Gfo/Idh/MocA family oxidoreductase [Chloroflexota bacterium]